MMSYGSIRNVVCSMLLGVCLSAGGALAAKNAKAAGAVTVTPLEGKVRVEIGGQLFTEYIYTSTPMPFLYPVIAPGGEGLTRNFPMKEGVPGEDLDHPHHRSLWFCHGNVNGINFWAPTPPPSGTIVQDKLEEAKVDGDAGVIRTHDRWVGPDGKAVLTDARTTTFRALPGGARAIDFEITLIASEGDVTFRDTKEGSMAMRTHAGLALQSKKGTAAGEAINSEGLKGKAIWGKHAKWVDYHGTVEGHKVGVAVFDNPANPRFPTTWHAREYGLIAVNPFGLHDFEGKPKGAGDLTIKQGEQVTFRYRFLFHEGGLSKDQVEAAWQAYAKK